MADPDLLTDAPTPPPLVCIGGIYRLVDDDTGEVIEVPVSADLVAAIAEFDRQLACREVRTKAREVNMTDLAAKAGKGSGNNDDGDDDGAPLEFADTRAAPWFEFVHFLGWGGTWPGPLKKGDRCPFHAGGKMPEDTVCIYCCKSGRDHWFHAATIKMEVARKAVKQMPAKVDGLKGGTA